jgi:hypothetical protein
MTEEEGYYEREVKTDQIIEIGEDRQSKKRRRNQKEKTPDKNVSPFKVLLFF